MLHDDRPLRVDSGLSRTQRAVQTVADFIVASERCKTARQLIVAAIICKNNMPESAGLIGSLWQTLWLPHRTSLRP